MDVDWDDVRWDHVRWDSVVDGTATAVGRNGMPLSLQRRPDKPGVDDRDLDKRDAGNRRSGSISVHVRLFGALASLSAERSASVQFSSGATLADVLAALGKRFGEPFLAAVLDPTGAKHRHCRLFVDGYVVEDLQRALAATDQPTEIEIILLIAPEGG